MQSFNTAAGKRDGAARLELFRLGALWFGVAVGLVVLCGYTLGVERAWRLAPGLPATHPLTALSVVLLGGGMLASRDGRRPVRLAGLGAIGVASAILVLGLRHAFYGAGLFAAMTPFAGIVARSAAAGHPIFMGTNSALAFLCVAGAHMLAWRGRHVVSQLLSGCALGLGVVATTGYIDGLHQFYGGMAPPTLAAVLALSAGALVAAPRQGFMRPLTADFDPGRLARVLLGGSTCLVLLIGWVFARSVADMGDRALFAGQTGAVIMLTWVLVSLATLRAEGIDRRRRQAERSLDEATRIDKVTGALSRDHMWSRLTGKRLEGQPEAILFVDLDDFRSVSAVFGPGSSDLLLGEIARRLMQLAGEYQVGRLRSDEFAVHCPGASPATAERLGKAITFALAEPLSVRGRSFHLTASVGIAHSEICGDINMLRAANEAMYIAKTRGGNQSVMFLQSMRETRKQEVQLGQDLYAALENADELSLAYQPVIDLATGHLVALEALARWTHPRQGPIPPGRFIEIAEKSGLMTRLGKKLMAEAVRQVAEWRDRFPDAAPVVNINISPLQFATGDVISDLAFLLRQHDLPPSRFCVEVTESAFANEQAALALADARTFGFGVAMDDFGVGYSSLSQLPLLPLTSIKLDRSFVVNATDNSDGALILSALVPLAHALRLQVVAEGVETVEQLNLVTQCACDAVQGYFFAQPLKPVAVEEWLTRMEQGRSGLCPGPQAPFTKA